MTRSMTGYASAEGAAAGWRWSWDIRSVNGRGLDIRLRLPDQADGVEAPLRAAIQKVVTRGNITVSMRLTREDAAMTGTLNPAALTDALGLVKQVHDAARQAGLELRPTGAAEILSMRGVVEVQGPDAEPDALRTAILAGSEALLAEFTAAREREGAALETVLRGQVERIAELTAASRELLGQRADKLAESFRAAAARVIEAAGGLDEARIAQELALIGIKADIAEELDRLDAHVAAARGLLDSPDAKGRKLDFLTQEFNREANTLCSKAQFAELTGIGLDLKHTIDQMREQVQNVE